jgi:DNA repair protein SbcD/Mre11
VRVLHTSDLHLGRQFNSIPLEDDHAAILDQIVRAVTDHKVDALVIAGDIFDRAAPPVTAVRQFNGFLSRVASESRVAVVLIAGNHDSGDRIESMSIMTDAGRALIRGAVRADETPLVLTDRHGPVAFSGLPFSYEYAARECFADESIQTPKEVVEAQIKAARRNVPEDARWVIVAHASVLGAQVSESERSLVRIGGVETVGMEVFDGAAYVALGHLHRAQSTGAPHIRYPGSPLAFGFDEAGTEKSMSLVEIDGAGQVMVEAIPFAPLRHVRTLRGMHAELLLADPSTDLVKAVLTDDTPIIDAMKQLRVVFPNACELVYEREERAAEIKTLEARATQLADPIEVVGDFLEFVRDDRMTDDERHVAETVLHEVRQEGYAS